MSQINPIKLFEVLEELPEAVFCLDSAGRILYASRWYESLTGIAPPRMVGTELFDLIVPEDQDMARDAFIEALLAKLAHLSLRVRLNCFDGQYVWVDMDLVLKLQSSSLGASCIVVFRDASARVQMESKLAQQQRELLGVNQDLERLLTHSRDTLSEAGKTFQSQHQALLFDSPYYALRIVSRPSFFLGGDIFFYRETRRGTLLVALADAMGHGPAAALRGVAVKATALSCLRANDDPVGLLSGLNEQAADYLEDGAYFTLILLEVDFQQRVVRVFNCGGPPVLFHNKQLTSINANNPPIGLFPKARYTCQQLQYQPVARLLLLSDGWLEPQSSAGNVVPVNAAQAFATFAAGEPVTDAGLTAAVQQLAPGSRFMDDLSAVQLTLKQR